MITESIIIYLMTLGDASSQFLNALLFNSKNANESISGKSYRMSFYSTRWRIAKIFIDALLFFDKNHCMNAYLNDVERAKKLIEAHENGFSR